VTTRVAGDRIEAVIEARRLRKLIPDADLSAFVERRSRGRTQVLVELRDAMTATEIPRRLGQHKATAPDRLPFVVATPTSVELADNLARITDRVPHYLWSARAFAVEATGDQLAEIASLPWVAIIRPSRRVRG
jgi:hypothetical protein